MIKCGQVYALVITVLARKITETIHLPHNAIERCNLHCSVILYMGLVLENIQPITGKYPAMVFLKGYNYEHLHVDHLVVDKVREKIPRDSV